MVFFDGYNHFRAIKTTFVKVSNLPQYFTFQVGKPFGSEVSAFQYVLIFHPVNPNYFVDSSSF